MVKNVLLEHFLSEFLLNFACKLNGFLSLALKNYYGSLEQALYNNRVSLNPKP